MKTKLLDVVQINDVTFEVWGNLVPHRLASRDEPGHNAYIDDLDICINEKSVYDVLDSRVIQYIEDTVLSAYYGED